MNLLEQDLQQSQNNIMQWLALYNKVSEDLVSLNFNTQLHHILDAIAGFDSQKIKALEAQIKDQVVLRHLSTISLKVKNTLQRPQASPQPPKRQSRIAEKPETKPLSKKEEKKQGFFSSVFNRFASKEKKSYEMILPEKEQNCYYDQKRKMYVFEGQEPEAPKQIPKPPSKSQIVKGEAPKKSTEVSQLDNLTAPPSFKRKGTSNNTKNKLKLKEEVQVLPSLQEQPMSFAKLIENINNQYASLIDKVKRGFYERHIPQLHSHNEQELSEFVGLAERLLSSAEQVSQQEHKLIDRWKKSMLAEPQQLKIMQKITKQISDSGNIYQLVNTKLDQVSREIRASHSNLGSEPRLSQGNSANFKEVQRLQIQLQRLAIDKNSFQGELSLKEAQLKMLRQRIQQKISQNQSLFQQNLELRNKIDQLQKEIEDKTHYSFELTEKIESNYVQKGLQQQKTIQRLNSESKELKRKIEDLKKEIQETRNQKTDLELRLKLDEANKSNSSLKVNQDLVKEKIKIQTQLKFYEEKEQNYISSIRSLQQQTSFMYECEETLQQENNLLNSILEKRIQLSKTDNEEPLRIYNSQEEGASPHSVILQLSDIINSITQTHLDRLENFNANYASLNKKYLEAKKLVKKIKNAASNENISLNRSVTRLKSLIQTYKAAKEESEEKCKLLELECEKLKKNLKHYKEEDKFNKSYLTKLKSSKTVLNQNDSIISLQEDNEALAQTIEDLQNEVGLKEENYTKLQKDLEDLLSHYEKNQARLNNIEKKSRENEKEVRVLREEKEELINKINLLQVKLNNQREKNEELVRYESAKTKALQATHEKKIKILKQDLERAQQAEEQIKAELEELRGIHQSKLKELNDKVREKESENGELLILIEATNEKVEEQAQIISDYQEKNEELERRQTEIAKSIHDYNAAELKTLKQSQKAHNEMIKSLIEQYKAFQEEQFQLRKEYQSKIEYLTNELNQSNQQSEQLLSSLQEYSQLVSNLDSSFKGLEIQSQQAKTEQQRVIQKLQIQNSQLSELVTYLQEQIEAKKQEVGELEILVQKISAESDALSDQVSELQKQKEDLSERLSNIEKQVEIKQSQITNKSQSLLIKNQELEEKNQILLESQENLVLTKEEIEGLRNELRQKDKTISELQNDLETLARQIAEQEQRGSLPSGQLLSENLKLKAEIKHLQDLCSQQSLKGQAKIIFLTENVAQKDRQIIRLQKQLNLSNQISKEQQKEISMLKEGIEKNVADNEKVEDEKQEEMQSEMQYLLKQIEDRDNENTQLKEKIRQLERELIVLKEEREEAKNQQKIKQEKEEEQQVQKQQQVEAEMEYLLKEIEEREQDITNLRQKITNLQKEIAHLMHAKDEAIMNNLDLNQQVKAIQKELSQTQKAEHLRLNQVLLLQKEIASLNELVDSLQRQIGSAQSEKGSNSTIELVTKLENEIRVKSKAITDLEIAKQQTQRLLFIAQNQKKQQQVIINDLENKIGELAQIIQAQEQTIGKTNTEETEALKQALTLKETQLIQAKGKVQQLLKVAKEQSAEYQQKIENLEREIVALSSLRTANKKLEDNIKSLQLQNATLLSEKVDLLRSNDNLMKINQKLITDISPHNKMNSSKPQPKQEKPKEPSSEGQKKEVEKKLGEKPEGEKKEAKTEEKQEPRGFFGAISSLFLTPTQSERLSRK